MDILARASTGAQADTGKARTKAGGAVTMAVISIVSPEFARVPGICPEFAWLGAPSAVRGGAVFGAGGAAAEASDGKLDD